MDSKHVQKWQGENKCAKGRLGKKELQKYSFLYLLPLTTMGIYVMSGMRCG
jgi:hypothetical protein